MNVNIIKRVSRPLLAAIVAIFIATFAFEGCTCIDTNGAPPTPPPEQSDFGVEEAAAPVPEPTPAPGLGAPTTDVSQAPQPKPIVIATEDGLYVHYYGPLKAQTGGTMKATFQITTGEGRPAEGTLVAILDGSPDDPGALQASGQLDAEGNVTLSFNVNWPPRVTKLYIKHRDRYYEVAEIAVTP